MSFNKENRGYFGIGLYKAKMGSNVGTLWRSANNFGAAYMFTISGRYKKDRGDAESAYKHIPLIEFDSFEDFIVPRGCKVIGVEMSDKSVDLPTFTHPERAIYILGPEDGSIEEITPICDEVVEIPTNRCINVAIAGSIVMYDRIRKEFYD